MASQTDLADSVKNITLDVNSNSVELRNVIINLTEDWIAHCTVGDYKSFTKMADPYLTCFTPETCGNLMQGLEFHRFYFDNVLSQNMQSCNTYIVNPFVHLLGQDAACIAFSRLTQYIDRYGQPKTQKSEETLVWQRQEKYVWQLVHFHRSLSARNPRDQICLGWHV